MNIGTIIIVSMSQSFLSRIQLLYKTLKCSAFDINAIMDAYEENGFFVSKRQIYRDISYLENGFLPTGEVLIKNHLNNRKCDWFIQNVAQTNRLDADYLYYFLLAQGFMPQYIGTASRDFFIDEFQKHLSVKYDNALALKARNKIPDANSIMNTNFLEKPLQSTDIEKFKELHWCIANKKRIKITDLRLDIKRNFTQSLPVFFTPIRFIVHQGNIYIGGIGYGKKILILDFNEIGAFQIVNSSIKGMQDAFNHFQNELSKRFGIAENIDDKVYDIQLEFQGNIGEHLTKINIHPSQTCKKHGNAIRMQIKCGINRELMSWIMSWMYHVKIVSPQKLKELHQYCHHKMKHEEGKQNKFSLFEDIFYK